MSAPTEPTATPPPETTTPNGVATEQPSAEEGIKLYVGNLAYAIDEESLKTFFAPVADDIVSVQVITRGSRPAGYGFVTVKTQEAVEKAISQLDKQTLSERPVVVEVAKPAEVKHAERSQRRAKRKPTQTGRRGNRPAVGEVTEEEANGEPAPARIDDEADAAEAPAKPRKKKPSKKKKAKAAAAAVVDAVVPNGDSAEEAPAADETVAPADEAAAKPPRGKKPRKPRAPRAPRPPRPEGEAPAGEPSKTVLFVANLAFSVDEATLTEFFTENGINVNSARVIRRRWGTPRKSKGYAFVDVGGEEEQQKAIAAVTGKTLADREIAVKVAVDAPPHDSEGEHAATTEPEGAAADPAAAA